MIAQRTFVEEELVSGRLVAPFDLEVPGDGAYYLSYPLQRTKGECVAAFEAWIMGEARSMNGTPSRRRVEGDACP